MTSEKVHITVCICTFKRPDLLERLLDVLDRQQDTEGFRYSVVVADNDRGKSAEEVVSRCALRACVPITYCVEPQQNIALARNRALSQATGDFVALIDDDEYPSPHWLCHLLATCNATGADGVLGPVLPSFQQSPPRWAIKGRFFERPTHETGHIIKVSDMRSGNVLLPREILQGSEAPFRAEFGTGGEDTDFFLRMVQAGCVFVWCNEAAVYEEVPPSRCKRRYLLERSLRSGNSFFKIRAGRRRRLAKSMIALPLYGLALPFLFIAGEHHFMKCLIKLCNHAGMILALFGVSLKGER